MVEAKYSIKETYELNNTTYIIYRIMNLINNKVYIGQTTNTFNIRYGRGSKNCGIGAERVLYEYERGPKNKHLYNSFNKYGVENFKVEVLKRGLAIEELNYWEEFYIALYNSTDQRYGYNYKKGGNNHEYVRDYLEVRQTVFDKLKDEQHIKFMDKMLIKLEEKKVDMRLIIDEIKSRRIVIIDDRDETKCWTYRNVIEASEIHTGCFRPEVLFIMAKHNEQDVIFDIFKQRNGSGRKVYFQDSIDITDKYIVNLCSHSKKTAKITHRRTKEERRRSSDSKEKREKKYKKKRSLNSVTICKHCGKEMKVKHYKICADCKAKIEYEKKKDKAIKEGKKIKVCPQCEKEHWLPQSDFCSSKCRQKYNK